MLKGKNIIMFSCGDWETPYPTSPQHLSKNFAEENRVLFVETFGSRQVALEPEHIRRIGLRLANWFKGIKKQNIKNGQLFIYSPIIPISNFGPFLFINRYIFVNMVKKLIKKLEMKNPILYFYIPPPANIKGTLGEKAIVYHCIDEWSTYPAGKNNTFMHFERELTKNADLVLVTNGLLFKRKKNHARRIHKIYHGVDYNHFTKEFNENTPLPADIKNIPRPIIAIIGTFASWMDLDSIKLIAQRHREWSIVSIGLIDSNVNIEDLYKMKNIYFLGPKNYSELPDYYRAIDVFIVPFLAIEHIKYCAPTRLYEHLASGKPIITTDFPAAHEVETGLINIASDKKDFIKKIEEALNEKDLSLSERRKEVAKRNTWGLKAEEILAKIEKILNEKEI